MELGKSRRQRAVRLTDEALRLLQSRVAEEWQRTGADDRLTWPVRASLLQVSVGTAKRVLSQMGNDKVVLQQAFAVLGIEWRDEYCEALPGSSETRQVDHSTLDPMGPSLLQETSAVAPPPRRPTTFVLVAGLSLAVLALIGLLAFRSQKADLPYAERPQAKELAVGRAAYHRAEYETAMRHVKEAYRLAYDVIDPNTMSEAIRVEGDVLAAQGKYEQAVERYRVALTFRTEFEAHWGRSSVLIALAIVEQKLNQLDDAETNLKSALDGMRKANDQAGIAEACRELGSVAAARGEVASARRWFDAASAAIAERPEEAMHIDLKARKAMLLSDEGKHEMALAVLEGCREEWKKREHPRWIATTLFQIGRVQWASGDKTAALQSIKAARGGFESVGDKVGVAECAVWLNGTESDSLRVFSKVSSKDTN